jgi:glycosyltransferase involved in cell wall biosynthesis
MRIDVLRNPMQGRYRLSLCGVVHDEMYFLPAFFAYYRGLGVERFALLDDASTDGTREYLAAQPDCMVVTSDVRYFDNVGGQRAIQAWRPALLDAFCRDQWSFFADADEFVALPDAAARVIASLERRGSASVWGVMLEMYPRDVAALRAAGGRPFDLGDEWYFDARPHLWVRPNWRKPLARYRGARARLLAENGIDASGGGALGEFGLRLGLGGLVKVNQQSKVPLVRWSERHRFDGSHRVTPPPAVADILPIMHFKFTGDLSRKVAYALETRGYAGGSRQYDLMGRLLGRMEDGGRSFIGPRSRRLTGTGELFASGVGRWTGDQTR